jgi:hypothetical protein
VTDTGLSPGVQATADGVVSTARDGDAFQARAVDQGGDDQVDDDPVGEASAVAAPWMGGVDIRSYR